MWFCIMGLHDNSNGNILLERNKMKIEIKIVEKRDELKEELAKIIEKEGAEKILWDMANSIDDDKLEDFISSIKWATGE